MPPETSPWERKDFVFKDRKHERGACSNGFGAGSSTPRWRDSYHGTRDFPRASPRRPPSGHYRQGGSYHQPCSEDTGSYGCAPSRSDRLWLEDESFRPSGRYGGGRSGNSSIGRDSRGSLRRSPYWDSSSTLSRQQQQYHESPVTSMRSVAVPISPDSQLPLQDQNDKSDGDVNDGRVTGGRLDRDHTLGTISWEPLKWPCPGSLSSAKVCRSEQEEAGLEVSVPPGMESPFQSPVTSPQPADDGSSRKKPRLGWGQGLAKYEKQKVLGWQETNETGAKGAAGDPAEGDVSSAGCSSLLVPSFASTGPPGIEDRPCVGSPNSHNNTTHLPASGLGVEDCSGEISIKLDNPDNNTMIALTTLLSELLQQDDASFEDSTFTRDTSINKLMQLKGDISKELEKTEYEIDLLESESKSWDCEAANNNSKCSSTLPFNSAPMLSSEPCDGALRCSAISVSHEIVSSVDKNGSAPGLPTRCFSEEDGEVMDVKLESPEKVIHANEKQTMSMDARECCSGHDDDKLKVLEPQEPLTVAVLGRLTVQCGLTRGSDALLTETLQLHLGLNNTMISGRNNLSIKEKFALVKRRLRFKKKVLTLKFRALHRLWKEDLRLLSIRKRRTKTNKLFELSSRSSQSGSQKLRSSIRSRFTFPAGILTLVPTTEVDFTSKLLSDCTIKHRRSNLKMPALILDDNERMHSKFISQNGLIEDPLCFEKERTVINPWTKEEKEVFMEMLATIGKDFSKISSYLNHKTTADCVKFYYQNHKSENFSEVKKCLDLRKQRQCLPVSTYLATSGKKWNPEMNAAAPLDILGAATVVAAHNLGCAKSLQKNAGKFLVQTNHLLDISSGTTGSSGRSESLEASVHERESVAADVLAGISGALSSEAMSSCITTICPGEKLSSMEMDRSLAQDLSQNFDEEEIHSDEECCEVESVDWSDEEKSLFIRAFHMYGKDFARISCFVGNNRSREQCKIFFSKVQKSLGLDVIPQISADVSMPMSYTNGGRSETDEACAAEMDSAICSTQSCSKIEGDALLLLAKTSSEGTSLQDEAGRSHGQDVVCGIDLEEENDCHIEEQELFQGNENLLSVVEKTVPTTDQGESGATALSCNDTTLGSEFAENCDTETPIPGIEHTSVASVEEGSNLQISGPLLSFDGLKKEGGLQQPMVLEAGSKKRKAASRDVFANHCSSLCFVTDAGTKENGFCPGNVTDVCSKPTIATTYQHQLPLDLSCVQMLPQGVSLRQKNCRTLHFNSGFSDTSAHFEGTLASSQITLNFEEHGKKPHQSSVLGDLYQRYIEQDSSLSQKVKREQHPFVSELLHLPKSHSKVSGISQSTQLLFSSAEYGKCSSSDLSRVNTGVLLFNNGDDRNGTQLRPCSQNASSGSEEQAHRTGDVKLFGTILSHPSSRKSSLPSNNSKSKPSSPKRNGSSIITSSDIIKDGNIYASKPGSSGHSGLEEMPVSSYGFWDGSRFQTGILPLAQSALVLTKEKCRGSGAVRNSNVVLSGYQQPLVCQMPLNGMQLENSANLQTRNNIQFMSAFQQSGRTARSGSSTIGGGGILGGVSDPVEALKRHYASSTSIVSEVESWRGEVGGR